MLFTLGDEVERPGVHELPFGATYRDLIQGRGHGLKSKAAVRGILPRGGTILGSSRTNPFKIDNGVERIKDNLASAGVDKVSPGSLIGTCAGLGLSVALVFYAGSRSWPIAGCFALFAAWLPISILRWRARKRSALLRQLWPDVVDHLRSANRSGLPLPEALIQLGEKGPEELRHMFREFGGDYRAGGQFDASLNKLKHRLADPVDDQRAERRGRR